MDSSQNIPRPEHPRPDFTRDRWLNMNGEWEFEIDAGNCGEEQGWASGRSFSQTIVVPFPPESELSGVGHKDFMPAVWYRSAFALPDAWAGSRVMLHFGAVDYEATVWLNGREVVRHRGGSSPFSAEITAELHDGQNELVVRAVDDNRSNLQPCGKQSQRLHSHGCRYTRVTGIWQTVWLECVPATFIRHVKITPDLDGARVILQAEIDGSCEGVSLRAIAGAHGKSVGEDVVPASWRSTLAVVPLEEVEPWEPGSPFLYDLDLLLERDGSVVDRVKSYFGLRKVHVDGNRILLNNRPLFQRLVLDQGYYPDGIWTAPTDEALRMDVEISMGLGFNGARLHQKVFEPRFLYWADRLGYLVWGEFASWGIDLANAAACENLANEWLEVVRRDVNHACVVGWCPFNETNASQRRSALALVYNTTRSVDPSRPVIDTSGYVHVVTDVDDCHDYDQNPDTFKARHSKLAQGKPYRNNPEHDARYRGQPFIVSEYGGIWWNPGQTDDKAWGYGDRPKTEDEFIARYRVLTEALLENPAMAGFCYTQLYDIEQEVNGLYTYDRRAKLDPNVFKAINTQAAAIETP